MAAAAAATAAGPAAPAERRRLGGPAQAAAAALDGVAEGGVEPTVDERVVAHGRHGQPMAGQEGVRVVAPHAGRRRHVRHLRPRPTGQTTQDTKA